MRGRLTKATGVAAMVAFALAIGAVPAAVAAGNDVIDAVDEFSYDGGIGDGTIFRLTAGQQPILKNSDPIDEHNVVSLDDGPDGEPLFSNSLVVPGASAPVEGTQYLQPGDYQFYCTIHQFGGMHGAIRVAGPGAVARPEVTVAVGSSKLKKLSKGKLKVNVTAATASNAVSVEARVGGKEAGFASEIDLAAGAKQTVTLTLGKQAKKAVKAGLKKSKKVAVSVSSEVPWGAPDSAKKNLR